LIWSEEQAGLVRRIAAGERLNDASLDWLNIAEEIESVGRGELRACGLLLMQALIHDLKMRAWPNSAEVTHWREEAIRFRQEAADAFSLSMRQRPDMARLYRRALQRLPLEIDGQKPLPVPETCPVTLDELLSDG
jgi:Domain of unknown function DUF29